MTTSVSAITATNRVNIPAVCRIPGRGSAVLVSPGILLTTKAVIGSNKADIARQTAVFFESGKKGAVEVKLLPNQYFFSSVYPEYLDYCLVACETQGIFGVAPVKLPLVRSEWQQVRETDTLLVVQHPLYEDAAAADQSNGGPLSPITPPAAGTESHQPLELKRFEEVLRRRDDVLYLKPHGRHRTFGCPCFNDAAELVGLQSQFVDPSDGIVSRVLSIVSIVKHLFANVQLSRIQQTPLFEDVWSTWYVQNDTTRIVAIMANFKQRDITRQAAVRLCEHTGHRELLDGVVAAGGTKVIVDCIRQFMDTDAELVALGLRSLWNISFTEEDNRRHIVEAGGIQAVLDALVKYPQSEEVAQFGVVVLFNLTLTASTLNGDWTSRGQRVVLDALMRFGDVEVIQKFGIGFFVNAAKFNPQCGREVLDWGGIEHIAAVARTKQHNEYLMENIIAFVALVAGHGVRSAPPAAAVAVTSKTLSESYSATPAGAAAIEIQQHPSLSCMVGPVLETATRYPSNGSMQRSVSSALWSLGNDAGLRVALLTHPLGLDVLKTSIQSVSSIRQL